MSKKRQEESLSRRGFLGGVVAAGATAPYVSSSSSGTPVAPAQPERGAGHLRSEEPNMETAFGWWTELPEKYTPLGWKDHMFRFNVLYEGTLMADPFSNQRTEEWRGQGIQLYCAPGQGGQAERSFFKRGDDNAVIQGWYDEPTPVLWSEWTWDALYLRQAIFAHVPGGQPVKTGIEPLYAWMRLSIHDVCEALPPEDRYGFVLQLNAPHITHSMHIRNNLFYHPERSKYPPEYTAVGYPRRIFTEPDSYSNREGLSILEYSLWETKPRGKVRLAVLPSDNAYVDFQIGKPTDNDSTLSIEMDVRKGAYVDVLVPMLPTDRDEIRREMELGYEGALEESNRFWSRKPETAATFYCGEKHIDGTIDYGLRYSEMIAEKDPGTGHYSLLTGSWVYANLWATPMAFTCIWLLDTMGYHPVVEKYLEMFKKEQGTVIPPGDYFKLHPGYLSTPKSLTAIDWLSDHGAILYAISSHGLLSGNQTFIDDWIPSILKACEFVRDSRRIRGHGGVEGIMPPAIATDRRTKIQAVWNDGWAYKGLITAVRLLHRVGHPRASEFEQEAEDYKKTYLKAIQAKTREMPTWTDSRGQTHHLVPTSLYGETKEELRHAFYVDCGPMFLVFSGLLRADDDLMKSAILWFREGPQTQMYREDSNCWQVPSLVHEVSSCEPNMSWSFFHSHQLGDRAKFLEGMYSLFANRISRQTYTNCETRGGVYALTPSLTEAYLARLAVIDDQLDRDELHLLRLMPLAWLNSDQPARFEKMPTEFGPVSLNVQLSADEKELRVSYTSDYRTPPSRVVLHIPPLAGLEKVRLNGRDMNWRGSSSISVT